MKSIVHLLCCAVFASACILPGKIYAQSNTVDGFINPAGRTILSLYNCFENYSHVYEGSELTNVSGGYSVNTSSLFASYSMTNDFEATANIPYVIATGYGSSAAGFQDLKFHINGRIFNQWIDRVGGISLIASFGVNNPLSKYNYEERVSIGQHSVNMDFLGAIHFQNKEGFFTTFTTGYTKRSTPFPDFYSNTFKMGVATEKVYVDAFFDAQHSFGGYDLNDPEVKYFLVGQSYSKVGVDGYYRVNDFLGFNIGAGYTLMGTNVGRAFSLTGGVSWTFGGLPMRSRLTIPENNPRIINKRKSI